MKKLSLIAAALLAISATYAQPTTVQFGIKGGVNLANIKIDNASDGDHRTGYHFGGLAHIHLSRQFALQPELVFSAQGREEDIAGVNYRAKLSYINVPVLLQYMAGTGFRIQTGPQLGLLVDAETEANGVEADAGKSFKKTDVSWAFGASYLTNIGLGFDARYNLGLSDINDDPNQGERKNRVWQFGVFYQFAKNSAHHRK